MLRTKSLELRGSKCLFIVGLAACAPMPAPGGPPTPLVERPANRQVAVDVPAEAGHSAQADETCADELDNQLAKYFGEIRDCYSRNGVSIAPELERRAVVEVRTDGHRRVVMARAANGTSVETCIVDAMAGWSLAVSNEGRPEHFMMRVPLARADVVTTSDAGALTPETVAATVQRQLPAVRECYERALKARPNLKGKMVVGWTIDRAGRVSLTRVEAETLHDDEMAACVLRRVLELTYVAPASPVDISFPFVFQTDTAPDQ